MKHRINLKFVVAGHGKVYDVSAHSWLKSCFKDLGNKSAEARFRRATPR